MQTASWVPAGVGVKLERCVLRVVEAGEEFHRRNRQLLQHEESSDDVEVRDGGGQMEEEVRLRESKYSTEPCTNLQLVIFVVVLESSQSVFTF